MATMTTSITPDLCMPFGRYKGVPISDLPADYMFWFFTWIGTYYEQHKLTREQAEALIERGRECGGCGYEDEFPYPSFICTCGFCQSGPSCLHCGFDCWCDRSHSEVCATRTERMATAWQLRQCHTLYDMPMAGHA